MTRWKVERCEAEDFTNVQVYAVGSVKAPRHTFVLVWASNTGVCCTRCSTLMCGMSGSCVHAKAVKRFIGKGKP